MAIKGIKGENNIKFRYFTPGLKIGIIISFISTLTYIGLLIFKDKKIMLNKK